MDEVNMKEESINFEYKNIKTYNFGNDKSKLFVIESMNESDVLDFSIQNKQILLEILLQYGGILFRNFSLRSVAEFSKVSQFFIPKLINCSLVNIGK